MTSISYFDHAHLQFISGTDYTTPLRRINQVRISRKTCWTVQCLPSNQLPNDRIRDSCHSKTDNLLRSCPTQTTAAVNAGACTKWIGFALGFGHRCISHPRTPPILAIDVPNRVALSWCWVVCSRWTCWIWFEPHALVWAKISVALVWHSSRDLICRAQRDLLDSKYVMKDFSWSMCWTWSVGCDQKVKCTVRELGLSTPKWGTDWIRTRHILANWSFATADRPLFSTSSIHRCKHIPIPGLYTPNIGSRQHKPDLNAIMPT